jgi:hypothetical protein
MFTIGDPNTILIGLVVIIVLIIIILGVIIWAAVRRPRPAQAAKPTKGAAPARTRLQEVLRLWRDPDTGRVITEFQNRAIRDPRLLSTSERDYLVRLAKDWAAWLDISGAPAASTSEGGPAAPVSTPDPANLASAAQAEKTVSTGTKANAPIPAPVQDKPAAASLLQPAIPRSIVEQVDDILQEKLAAHPGPIPSIKLVEDPYEGVIVWVNQTKYVGIESVTDPTVRTLIRSAAVEWEHRTEK